MVSATASGEHGELNVADTPPADRTLPPLPDTFPPLPPQTASELLSLADQRHPSNWLEDTLSPDSYFDPPSTFLDGFDRDIYDRGNNFVNIFPMAPSTKKPAQLSATPIKPQSTSKPTARSSNDAQAIVEGVWSNYVNRTPQRVKLLDTFMAFLIVVGVLQFVYCVIAGNYPFNAFLSGFSATVGQFVLTASLRIQTNPENKKDFEGISHERAFADFIFGSLILHFFCVNFIN